MCVPMCVSDKHLGLFAEIIHIHTHTLSLSLSHTHAVDDTHGLAEQKRRLTLSQHGSLSIDWLSFLSFSESVQSATERI